MIDHVPNPLASKPDPVSATPVLFLSEGECLVATGAGRVLAVPQDLLAVRTAAYFAERREPSAVLVGALPFEAGHDAHLVEPLHLERLPLWNLRQATPAAKRRVQSIRLMPDGEGYRQRVRLILDRIGRDGLRKVVLSRRLTIEFDSLIDPLDVVTHLQRDPRVTTFCVPLPGARGSLVGATPELLIAKKGISIHSAPLAGSARRHAEAALDRAAAERLLASEKDQREHATVVEWIADRLQPFCRTLQVPASPAVTSTATMWHLGTSITGELKHPDTSSIELAALLHPTPAVCGVPHGLAADAIAKLEPFDRGFFSGAVGWTAANGDGRWLVAIRCAEIDGPTAHLFAGAGIVAGSEPAAEFDETSAKLATLLTALGVDTPGADGAGRP